MKRNILNIALCAALLGVGVMANAKEDVRGTGRAGTTPSKSFKTEAGDCTTPTAQFDMDINNVRARLLTGGDMWWNLSEARYQVPKGDGTTGTSLNAIFAGSIWISGVDAGGNLKVAAQRYRQGGDDFWPGPIVNGVVDKATCNKYDRFFNVYGADIEKAQAAFSTKGVNTTLADIPTSVQAWPGKGNPYISTDPNLLGETFIVNENLAPFKDVDNDGIYDPVKGDYPYIPCRNGDAEAYGDQMVFWVFNDAGNLHTESSGQAIGVQVNSLAFAFQTNDDINNMTFYKYEVINKSSNALRETYISQWADPDLGCFSNDRVGCDVNRSLGVVYNGTTPDPDCNGVSGYGTQLPLIGIDFFEGPLSDSGQQLGLSSFVYFTNGATTSQTDPSSAAQYRNYMTCKWADGTPFTFGGTGYNSGGPSTCFIFPGNPSDASQWSESQPSVSTQLTAGDRRMVQTSGPFTLTPGVSQYITIGVVFVRPALGPDQVTVPPNFNTTIGPADDKAQALFNTCFKLVDGPRAPDLKIRELSNQLIINLENPRGSNNFGEGYDEVDGPTAQKVQSELGGNGDSTYTFEGYVLYQLADARVSATDLPDPQHADPTKAKIVARVDVKNDINAIINYEKRADLGGLYVPVLKVDANGNTGITTSFNITSDLFATGDNNQLVNNKTYYYAAIAYAYNNYRPYDPDHPLAGGQQTPFLQGRKNFMVYSAIPHGTDPRNGGTALNAVYGDGVEVKRIEGRGNGGNIINITDETTTKILASGSVAFTDTLTYVKSNDPIGFKVTDPINLKEADFELSFVESSAVPVGATTRWQLRDLTNGITIDGDRPLDRPYEQQIVDTLGNQYGFSIKLGTPAPVHVIDGRYLVTPTGPNREVYDVLPSTITYANPTQKWLSFVKDEGTTQVSNWIRSGTQLYETGPNASGISLAANEVFDDNWYYYTSTTAVPEAFHDSTQIFDKILDGTWAPYCLTSNYNKTSLSSTDITNGKPPYNYGPGFKWRQYGTQTPPQNTLDRLQSVDIVITDNKALWSRCVVFETGEDQGINQGADLSPNGLAPRKGQLRMAHSKRWHNGDPSNPDYLEDDPTDIGRSYFPGYAINVETGERLNIAFGESSDQGDQNGRDMLWDPTDQVYSPISFPGQIIDRLPYFGGKHFIYVMDSKYDGGDSAQQLLLNNYTLAGPLLNINTALQPLYQSLMWTCIPYLTSGYSFAADQNGNKYIPPADITVKLRVETPYNRLATNATTGDPLPRYQFSTKGMGATQDNNDVAKSALDNIRIVPNPYLAYSAYETDQNSTLVKITNLPNKCNITIYSLDGTIIRKLTRSIEAVDPATNQRIDISDGAPISDVNLDNSTTWDLKNDKSIPIASGIYLFHIEAPGIGEKTLKWFGAIRPADTSNF